MAARITQEEVRSIPRLAKSRSLGYDNHRAPDLRDKYNAPATESRTREVSFIQRTRETWFERDSNATRHSLHFAFARDLKIERTDAEISRNYRGMALLSVFMLSCSFILI